MYAGFESHQVTWGNNDIVVKPDVESIPGNFYRKDLYAGEQFILFRVAGDNYGSPTVGRWKCRIYTYVNGVQRTKWVRGYCNADGSGTHPTDAYGRVLNGVGLYAATIQSDEIANYAAGRYYRTGTANWVENWFYLPVSEILNALGVSAETMVPEKVVFNFNVYGVKDTDWNFSEYDTVIMYGQDWQYPKLTYTYSGTDLVNNKYYDNISSMTINITVTESLVNGYNSRRVLHSNVDNKVTVDGGVTVEDAIPFNVFGYSDTSGWHPSDFFSATCTKTISVELGVFNDYINITTANGLSSASDSFEIPYFPYIKPSCYETSAYRTGDSYEIIKIDGVGTYVDYTEFPVTLSYRWRLSGEAWGNWITLATASTSTVGPIEQSTNFNSPMMDGDVEVQMKITDTLQEVTFTIFVVGPLFHWSGTDFKFAVPVTINTNQTPITINGVSLDDYIRSVQ